MMDMDIACQMMDIACQMMDMACQSNAGKGMSDGGTKFAKQWT